MMFFKVSFVALCASALLWLDPAIAQSQDSAKLKVHEQPKQAYLFVDGKAIRAGSHAIHLSPGDHTISVRNYGYTPDTQKVQLTKGNETKLNVDLHPYGGKVSGPFADIEFKGDSQAAVLLNGATPAYFVGRAGEFDWDWLWHRRLLVQPGSYHVTVMREGNTIWTGNVTASAGKKVIIHLNDNGREVDKNFAAGEKLGPQPRFHAGILSRIVPVAPVTAELAANSDNVGCGADDTLKWNSTDAVNTSITGLGSVPNDGDRVVKPTQDMSYVLKAIGPGGEVTKTVTVDVNKEPTATLALSEPVIHYHKIGDKVVQQESATLRWSASNAASTTISPFGKEALDGSQTITADPKQQQVGSVDQDLTYTLTASNPCGGAVTKTATLQVEGSIDPPPSTTLASLFYPTAYPTRRHPKIGLVPSEKAALDRLASQFKNFGDYEQNANLMIVGYADIRGGEKYNQALSERRAELAKAYLVSKGVPASDLEVQSKGKDDQLSMKKVESLQSEDSQKPEKWMTRNQKATWLAYNRRVDVVLEPTGQKSTETYPNDVASARLLWQRPMPSLRTLTKLTGSSAGREQASLTKPGA
ncbi:MAG TPA: OmpA family protein [Terracidiphilus sp.]|nr:OmpA family protein [Terracidiphilus sp.]